MTGEVARILVVDDEPDVEALVTQKFRREIRKGQMEFVFAQNGQDALKLLSDDPEVMMVLSDINMPKMDGLTLLTHLGEDHQNLKTVVVSAYGDMENIRTAMNRGAFDFVTKPIDFADLDTTIRKTLAHLVEFRNLQREKSAAELAQATLSRYFSPSVIEALSDTTGVFETGGKRCEASFLFTDLSGFTPLVEAIDAKTIGALLNDYIDGIASVIFAHEGTVMKVVGDAIQATFGAPVTQSDHAARAVNAALDIDAFAEDFRKSWQDRDVDLGVTRVGVNTGEAIIGNFGGSSFFDYTAYGDCVNIAARLEAANKDLGTRICVSQATRDQIRGFRGRPSGNLILPGKSIPLAAFEPLTEERDSLPIMDDYKSAYVSLANGAADARQLFAALIAELPDDPLTLLHLQRSLSGALDVNVEIKNK